MDYTWLLVLAATTYGVYRIKSASGQSNHLALAVDCGWALGTACYMVSKTKTMWEQLQPVESKDLAS